MSAPAQPCTPADKFAHCNFKRTGRLNSCHEPGGCLHQIAAPQNPKAGA